VKGLFVGIVESYTVKEPLSQMKSSEGMMETLGFEKEM
jgi:hypothetical protein